MSKFLALTLPPSHNQGVSVNSNDLNISPPVSPVFATQPPDQQRSERSQATQNSTSAKSNESGKSRNSSSQASSGSTKFRRKNFIKRNKEACILAIVEESN